MLTPPPMQPLKQKPTFDQQVQVMRILWFALTFSTLMNVFVAYAQSAGKTPVDFVGMPTMAIALTLADVGFAVGSVIYRSSALSERSLQYLARGYNPVGAPPQETDKGKDAVIKRWQGVTIISLVLHETITALGLVLSLLMMDWTFVLPFAAATIILNFLVYPNFPAIARKAGLPMSPIS